MHYTGPDRAPKLLATKSHSKHPAIVPIVQSDAARFQTGATPTSATLSPPGLQAIVSGGLSPHGRRLRVLYCIDNMRTGGTELNAVRTAERLDPTRFELAVMTFRADGPLAERYARHGIRVIPLPIGPLWDPKTFAAGLRFLRELRAWRPDVVHAHDAYTTVFATPWARLARVPVIIASRRSFLSNHLLGPIRTANRIAYRMADRVWTNSPTVARFLTSEEGVRADRLVTLPNFVDDELFVPITRAQRDAGRAALGIQPNALLIGVVARLSKVKDHDTFLRALAKLHQWHPQVRAVLVGDGPRRADLESLRDALGLHDVVTFLGERADALSLYPLFDVSVLSSRSEAFPNAIVEAMAAACPVVASRVGGIPDAVVDGETGVLAPAGDPNAFATAIAQLLGDPAQRARFATAARARAQREYAAASVIARVSATYEHLVASRAR